MNIAKKALLTVATLANMVVAGQASSTVASTKEPIKNTLTVVDNLSEDFIKANFLINGSSPAQLALKDMGDNVYALTYEYTFPGIKGISESKKVSLTTKVELSYDKNNVYIQYQETIFPNGVNVSEDGKEIVVGNVVYDISYLPDTQTKLLDLRIIINPEKTHKRIVEKISSITNGSQLDIEEVESLENLQLTSLSQISLGEEIYQDKTGGYYRVIFLQEGNRYLPVKKLFFTPIGEIDTEKTKVDKTELTVMGKKLIVNASLKGTEVTIKSIDNIDDVQARVETHQKKLIEMINKAKIGSPEVFVGANKTQQERAWSDGKEIFTFDSNTLKIRLVDDTYLFQWGENEDQVIRFGVTLDQKDPSKDKFYLKNIVGEKVSSYDIAVGTDFYTIKIQNDQLVIDKITSSKDILTQEFPSLVGDETITSLFGPESNAKIYKSKKNNLEYFDEKGKLTMVLNTDLTEKGLWKLEDTTVTVLPEHLFSIDAFADIDLASLNLTEKDLQNVFISGLATEKVDLTRTGVRVYNKADGKYYYYTVDQKKPGEPFVFEKDMDLYEDVDAIIAGMKQRLQTLISIQNIQLKWKNGDSYQDFEGFVGGGWGLAKAPIATADKLAFLNESTDHLPQTVVWGEGSKTVIVYVVHKGKISLETSFLKKSIKSPISGQTYKIFFDPESSQVVFDPIEKKKK